MKECMTQINDKQVINICDGRILGFVTDFRIDPCDGKLTAIILPGEGGIFSLRKCPDIIISWDKICKIGIDVILVDIGVQNDPEFNQKCLKNRFQ